MPIFAYRCAACGQQFDELQKLGAPPLTECPACGKPELQKLLSAPSFHLKGGGWRNSEEPKPKKRPKYMHTFDSPVPHAEHHDHGHGHADKHGRDGGHDHKHGHDHGHEHDHRSGRGGHGHRHDD